MPVVIPMNKGTAINTHTKEAVLRGGSDDTQWVQIPDLLLSGYLLTAWWVVAGRTKRNR